MLLNLFDVSPLTIEHVCLYYVFAKKKRKINGFEVNDYYMMFWPNPSENAIPNVCPSHNLLFYFQRKALVVLFQHWFSAAAEETSAASRVAVYLREVKKATPSLLAFLINLADDNGNTALHYSVSHCNYSIVSHILDTGNNSVLPELLHKDVVMLYILGKLLVFGCFTGVGDLSLQNNAGYTAVMLASLTAPDGPGGMEVVRKLMEQSNIHIRSSQVKTIQCKHSFNVTWVILFWVKSEL